jgi:hypothetical protein
LRALEECTNTQEKRMRALNALLLASESPSGYLYGVDGERLTWSVASADEGVPETLVHELNSRVREYANFLERTASVQELPTTQATSAKALGPVIRCEGQLYRHLLVERCIGGELELIAIAAVQVLPNRTVRIPARTMATVAHVLSR